MRDKLFTCVVLLHMILAFMGQAQYRASTIEVYRARIMGYDPRDLLRGHYLRYRFDFSKQLTSSASLSDYCFVRKERVGSHSARYPRPIKKAALRESRGLI